MLANVESNITNIFETGMILWILIYLRVAALLVNSRRFVSSDSIRLSSFRERRTDYISPSNVIKIAQLKLLYAEVWKDHKYIVILDVTWSVESKEQRCQTLHIWKQLNINAWITMTRLKAVEILLRNISFRLIKIEGHSKTWKIPWIWQSRQPSNRSENYPSILLD